MPNNSQPPVRRKLFNTARDYKKLCKNIIFCLVILFPTTLLLFPTSDTITTMEIDNYGNQWSTYVIHCCNFNHTVLGHINCDYNDKCFTYLNNIVPENITQTCCYYFSPYLSNMVTRYCSYPCLINHV